METTNNMQSSASSGNVRSKTDPAWEHFTLSINEKGTKMYHCLYCGKKYQGGGIYRMKEHLAGKSGNILPCVRVPSDVRAHIKEYITNSSSSKSKEKELVKDAYEEEEEVEAEAQERNPTVKPGKRKGKGSENCIVAKSTPLSQPGIKSAMASKQAIHRANMAFARWCFDACIPFNAMRSPYFQPMLDAIGSIGAGYKAPSYNDMRINLLRDCKKECQLLIDSYRSQWANCGCTIMGDGWTDQRQRTLINFMVYCPAGVSFVKSVDASDIFKNATNLCNLFTEIIEWVGPTNVVHLVTDNASNYVAAGRLIHEKYDHIYWSPCAAHCLNLILKDIGKRDHVVELISRASKVTVFVYNHIYLLTWLRKRFGWTEIVRPGATRFATTFITLKSIFDHKHDLQALVTDKYYTSHKLSKSAIGKTVTSILLDAKFWEECLLMVKIAAPIIRLLRVVDADEKPSLGYVYEGMIRIRKAIMAIFKNKSTMYGCYIKIIDERWDKHLRRNLHAAAYFLNPAFLYDKEAFIETPEVMQGLLDLLEKRSICSDSEKAMMEIRLYRDRIGSFNRESTLSSANKMQPDEWWRLFGHSAPFLQRVAIRLLSQTSSSSGCERNWSVFERIHTKRRNRLEHQRLSDLVFVNYNLRLKCRHQYKKRSYDPVDYDCIDKTDFWIAEEAEEEEMGLIDGDMGGAIYGEDAIPSLDESHIQDDMEMNEDVDFELFGNASYDDAFDQQESLRQRNDNQRVDNNINNDFFFPRHQID